MSPCPPPETLESMLKGPSDAFRDIEKHVEECNECMRELESLASSSIVLNDLRAGSTILSSLPEQTVHEIVVQQTLDQTQTLSTKTNQNLPRQFDRYQVISLLGQGGMGQVYLAKDPELKRQVAIKVLKVDPQERPEWLARFRREVEVLANLHHPHIIEVFDICYQASRPYFVMEYLEGGSLSEFLSQQLLSIPEACSLIRQLAIAVDAAHQHGIIHRDLKPSNILFSQRPQASTDQEPLTVSMVECQPKITDFGLAKKLEHDAASTLETKAGLILGTPGYMAPEQSLSAEKDASPSLDIYSLGAIFYECLTGRPPFKGASVLDTLHLSLFDDPLPPQKLRPQLSNDLQAVCLKCLNRQPNQRYASGRELADDIDRYLAGLPTVARPISTLQRAAKWCRRSPMVASLLALLILLVVATISLMAWYTIQLNQSLRDNIAEEQRATQAQAKTDAGYRLARTTIMAILKRAREAPNSAIPQLLELERKQYDDALGFFRQAIQNDKQSDPHLRAELAEAIALLANCNTQVNRVDDAIAGYREASGIYEELLQSDPDSIPLQYQKAFCQGQIGYLLLWNRPAEAEPALKESVRGLESLVQSKPDAEAQTWFRLAHTLHSYGMLCRRADRVDEAKEHYQRSIELHQQHPYSAQGTAQRNMMADSWIGLGLVAWGKKQWKESSEAYSQAHQLLSQLLKENPRNLDAAAALGALCINYALLEQDQEQFDVAMGHFSEAIATLEAARTQEPNFIRLRLPLYNSYSARAALHRRLKHYREAAGDIERSLPYSQPARLGEKWQLIAEDWLNAEDPTQVVKALAKVRDLDDRRFQELIQKNEFHVLMKRPDFQLLMKTPSKQVAK